MVFTFDIFKCYFHLWSRTSIVSGRAPSKRWEAGVWFPHSPHHLLYGANGSLTLQVSVCLSAKTEVSEYVHTYPSLAFRKLWVQKESSTFKLLQIALSLANEQAHRINIRSHAERKPSVHVHARARECAWFQY